MSFVTSKKAFETIYGDKQRCRELICELADQEIGYSQVKKIFTLPSKEALCYEVFKRHYKRPRIVCIERDPEICEYLWDEKNIDCTNTTVRDYSQEKVSPEQHHDIIFLDYYSFLSKDILEDIKCFLENDNILHKNKKSIIAITLMKGMRVNKNNTISVMREFIYQGERKEITNNVENVTNAIKNYISCLSIDCKEVKLLESLEYKAGENSSPMYFLVFSVEK